LCWAWLTNEVAAAGVAWQQRVYWLEAAANKAAKIIQTYTGRR